MKRNEAPPGPRGFDMRRVKDAAARLPKGDPVRDALLMEPDVLPLEAGLSGKLSTYLLMLLRSRKARE